MCCTINYSQTTKDLSLAVTSKFNMLYFFVISVVENWVFHIQDRFFFKFLVTVLITQSRLFQIMAKTFLTHFTFKPKCFVHISRYIVDHDDPSLGKTTVSQWIIRIVFLLLQFSPLLRYIDTLIYGIRSRIAAASEIDQLQNTLYRRMLDEDSNAALLRLFHCFLHSTPQAVIQLMILLTHVVHQDVEESLGPGRIRKVAVVDDFLAYLLCRSCSDTSLDCIGGADVIGMGFNFLSSFCTIRKG